MVITIGNNKGGVGKTTLSTVFTYILSDLRKEKVLVIDTDQQSNLSKLLEITYEKKFDENKNIYQALFSSRSIKDYIQPVTSTLDILVGSWDMANFENNVGKIYKEQSIPFILRTKLEEVRNDYDYIIIDTSPTTGLSTQNAIIASDYVIIATQTVPLAFDSTDRYFMFLTQISNQVFDGFELLGIVPYLVGDSSTDRTYIQRYNSEFHVDCFSNMIKASDRVKSWSNNGITSHLPYDKRTLKMYEDVLDEALTRTVSM